MKLMTDHKYHLVIRRLTSMYLVDNLMPGWYKSLETAKKVRDKIQQCLPGDWVIYILEQENLPYNLYENHQNIVALVKTNNRVAPLYTLEMADDS